MSNLIIVFLIVLAASIGIVSSVRHFQGKGSCCGGGGYKPKQKKLSHVIAQKTFQVDGMHCKNCKIRVEEIVNDIKGVSGAVDLKKGLLTVSYAEEVPDDLIQSRIERAGYIVTAIHN